MVRQRVSMSGVVLCDLDELSTGFDCIDYTSEFPTARHSGDDFRFIVDKFGIMTFAGEVVRFVGRGWEAWVQRDCLVNLLLGWLRCDRLLRNTRYESFDDLGRLRYALDEGREHFGFGVWILVEVLDEQ
jgi:hypothetical protein